MKKYLVLTSVLALAACGGGGHGGGSVNAPDTLNARITDAAAASNQAITAMKSQVIVSNKTSGDLSRSATATVGGVTFTSYDLSDVKLFAADADHTDNGYLKIGMDDNGRIEKITMNIGEVGAPVIRDGEGNRFKGPIFEYVEDGDQAAYRVLNTGQTAADLAALKADLIAAGKIHDGGHWNMINEEMDVVTLGRDIDGNGTALQYADFGHFNPVYRQKYLNVDSLTDEQMALARSGASSLGGGRTSSDDKVNNHFDDEMAAEDYQLFAGGYAIRGTEMKDTLAVPRGAEFKGKAIGRVYTTVSVDKDAFENSAEAEAARTTQAAAAGYSDSHDINKAFTTTEATLKIDANGKQTLEMPFYTHSDDPSNRFYDVKLVKKADGTIETPVFTGTPTNADHNLYNALEGDNVKEASFNPGYYGVNTAVEAAGTARLYSEENLGNHVTREYEVQAAYGMKRQ